MELPAGKLELLEAMRGLAAVWVLIHHGVLSTTHFVGSLGEVNFLANGLLGVDFFFVLSGFIIALSAHRLAMKGGGLSDYFRARMIRIYVPYVPIGIGMYLLYLALPEVSQGDRTISALTSLTLLPDTAPPALSVAWTLVHEMIFYAVFSVWFVSPKGLFAAVGIWTGAIVFVRVQELDVGRFSAYFLSPLNLYFVLGVIIARTSIYLEARRNVVSNRALPVLVGALGILLVLSQACSGSPTRLLAGIGFGLIVAAASMPPLSTRRVWRGLLAVGAASYSIYLVHNPAHSVVVRVAKRAFIEIQPWPAFAITCSVSLLMGILYWWLYERHAMKLAKRILSGRMGLPSAPPKLPR